MGRSSALRDGGAAGLGTPYGGAQAKRLCLAPPGAWGGVGGLDGSAAAAVGRPGAAPGFADAYARLRSDPRFQFDLPPFERPQPPSWLKPLGAFLRSIGPTATWVFWGLVALGVGAILVLVGRELLRQRRTGRVRARVLDPEDLRPSGARVRALLAEADRLAAEGRFGEAVRVLLLRTLDDLEARRPGIIGPAQTAREIAALETVPAAAREPLAAIARAVERFLFAGRPLDAAAFQSARADYARFVEGASAS